MEVTRVSVSTWSNADDRNVLAYASITLDDALTIKDIKIIEIDGVRKIAMPNRAYRLACGNCYARVAWMSRYCMFCGFKFPDMRELVPSKDGRQQFWVDVAHPIQSDLRRRMELAIFGEYDRIMVPS